MVALLTSLGTRFPRGVTLTAKHEETLDRLERLLRARLQVLTWETSPRAIARTTAKTRAAFLSLLMEATFLAIQAEQVPTKPVEFLRFVSQEIGNMADRIRQALHLSARSNRALQSAVESYTALLDRLSEEARGGGLAENTERLLLEARDSLTDFQIAVVALHAACQGYLMWRPDNLEALVRLADRAMLSVEDVFLAASLKEETAEERTPRIPLDEVLKELGV